MNAPKVIVLILSYDGKALLEDAVPSYLANTYLNFEVIVVDNGSSDGTKAYVEENWPEAEVYRSEQNLGYSGGFNFGLEYAFRQRGADYVLITNNDVKADPQAVSALVKTAEKSETIGFVTGKVFYFDAPELFQTAGYTEDPLTGMVQHRGQKEADRGQYAQDEPLVSSDDVFMLVRREVYEQVGGYDTNFFIQGEQWDWQERGKKKGFEVYFSAGAKIWHKESMTIGRTSAFKLFYDLRNNLIVIFEHKSARQFARYFWKSFKHQFIIGGLKHFLKARFTHAYSSVAGFLSGFMWVLRDRRITLRHFI